MKLSTKRHGYFKAFYYMNPLTFHRYTLDGHTAAEGLNWMFEHISTRTDINRGDLKLVVYDDGGVRMINRNTGGRLYAMKTPGKGRYQWFEEPAIRTDDKMHEEYDYNQ